MTYQVHAGISEAKLNLWLKNAAKKYGQFKDGRVDYTNADIAPIVMCTLKHKDKILLAKRGYGLADAEGYWSTINGFIDEIKPVSHIARQELEEELDLIVNPRDIKVGSSYTLNNPKAKRQYIVFPCLVKLTKKPKINLNKEHTDFVWIKRSELMSYHILDDLPYAIDSALKL